MSPEPESPVSHPAEFADWLAVAQPGEQTAAEEFLAEHHLMAAVHVAMTAECERMAGGGELRPSFWAEVVGFLGDFVHRSHRRKEETVFYPTMQRAGVIADARVETLQQEHVDAKELTFAIVEGVDNGDWEQVERVAATYVYFMRHHMKSEEIELVEPSVQELDDVVQDEIAEGCQRIEAEALGAGGRRGIVDRVDRIRAAVGLSSM